MFTHDTAPSRLVNAHQATLRWEAAGDALARRTRHDSPAPDRYTGMALWITLSM